MSDLLVGSIAGISIIGVLAVAATVTFSIFLIRRAPKGGRW
jgi:hypothetical protein